MAMIQVPMSSPYPPICCWLSLFFWCSAPFFDSCIRIFSAWITIMLLKPILNLYLDCFYPHSCRSNRTKNKIPFCFLSQSLVLLVLLPFLEAHFAEAFPKMTSHGLLQQHRISPKLVEIQGSMADLWRFYLWRSWVMKHDETWWNMMKHDETYMEVS